MKTYHVLNHNNLCTILHIYEYNLQYKVEWDYRYNNCVSYITSLDDLAMFAGLLIVNIYLL